MMHVSMVIHDAYSWFMIHYAHSFRDGTRSWDAGLQFESLCLFLCLCVTSSGGTEIEVYSNMFSRLPTEKIKNAKQVWRRESLQPKLWPSDCCCSWWFSSEGAAPSMVESFSSLSLDKREFSSGCLFLRFSMTGQTRLCEFSGNLRRGGGGLIWFP